MASLTVKEILLKWGIDNSNWKKAITELAQMLDKANKASARAQDQAQKKLESQKQKLTEVIQQHKSASAEIDKQIEKQKLLLAQATAAKAASSARLAQEKLAASEIERQVSLQRLATAEAAKAKMEASGKVLNEKAAAEAIGTQAAEQRVLQQIQRTLQQEVNTKLIQEKLVTAEIQRQAAELRKQVTDQNLRKKLTSGSAVSPVRMSSASAQSLTALNLRLAQGEVLGKKELEVEYKKILVLMDQEIAKAKLAGLETEKQVTQLSRMARERARIASLAGGAGGGGKPPAHHEEGMLGGFAHGLGSALFGGGLGVTLFAAVASAQAFGEVVGELTNKMKEFIESTGPLQQVREQFEKLAITSGKDPSKFIDDLRKATHGLVDDMALYRNANTFLQSGVKASQQDITELTQATIGLARAQGRDAQSAVEALNRFFLTGRAVTLAYTTGIQRTQLQVGEFGHSTDSATRSTLAFKQAQEAIVSQYKAIGEPILTYTDRMKQLEIAQHNFWEEVVIGLTKSKGFQSFLDWIGQLADNANKLAEKAIGWGETLGSFFSVLVEAGKAVTSIFSALNDVVEGLFSVISAAFPESAISDGFTARLSTVHQLAVTTAQAFVILRSAVEEFGLRTEYTLKEAASSAKEFLHWLVTGSLGLKKMHEEQAKLHAEFLAKLKANEDKEYADILRLEGQRKGGPSAGYKISYAAPSNVYTEQQSLAADKKIAQSKQEIANETARIELEQTQLRIKKEEELTHVQYEQGLLTIKDYLAKKADLEAQDHEAKLKQLKAEFDAKMQFLDIEGKQSRQLAALKREQADADAAMQLASIERQRVEISLRLKEDVANKRVTQPDADKYSTDLNKQFDVLKGLIEKAQSSSKKQAGAETAELDAKQLIARKKYWADVLKEQADYQAKGRQLTEQDIQDQIAARQKLADAILAIDKTRTEREREATDYEFEQGAIGAQQYLDRRVQYAEQDFQAVKAAAEKKLLANKDSETAQAEFAEKMAHAAEDREKALTKLSLDEIEIRTKAFEQSYDRVQKLIDSQIQYQQSISQYNYFGGKGAEQDLIQKQIELLKSRLAEEIKSLALTERGTAAWFQQYEKIQSTKGALVSYNQELVKSKDIATGIASALKEMASAASRFPKGGKVAEALGGLASVLEEQEQVRKRKAARAAAAKARAEGKDAPPVTPEEIFKSLQKASQKAGEDIGKHLADASESVDEWRRRMVDAGAGLDESIVKTTEALLTQLIPAIEKVAGVVDGTAPIAKGNSATKSPTKYDSGTPHVASKGPQQATKAVEKITLPISGTLEDFSRKITKVGSELDGEFAKATKALRTFTGQLDQNGGSTSNGGWQEDWDIRYPRNKQGSSFAVPQASSGPSTAEFPLGTQTASDIEKLQPAWLSSMPATSSLGGGGEEASTGLSAVAQTANNLQKGFKNLLDTSVGEDGLLGYFKNLGKDSDKASEGLSNFVDTVSQIAGEVGGLISAAKGTGGPLQAGLTGAQAGGSLGGQIGSIFGPMGGMIGSAIGAGAGLIVGVFAGKAKKEAERIAKTITAQFNAVLVGVQNGTVGLGKAVASEISTIQQAVSQLSGKKGGRDELKQILPQMEQQLAQLQQQQQSIIKSFDKQLEISSSPEASRALVQPIQQIIDTYQQYILAGGNVQLANKYLQDSFQSLVTQGLDQLNQSEQDAVNNALNYNDLLLQRQELIQNTNQQIQDIMSQGVAVRQMPQGVTKARQIQQLMLQATNQQAQLDQEIAVSKHKLENESKIFNLATTRVGLETQLIALQNAQTDKSDAATQALLQEVAAFSTSTPTNMPTALGLLGLGNTYVNPNQEAGLKPTPPVKTGIYEVDLQNQLQYQQALAYYQQQIGLSSSSTLSALGVGGLPGGTMGVTVAGSGSTGTLSSTMVGGALDSLASNISALVSGLSSLFGLPGPVQGSTTSSAPAVPLPPIRPAPANSLRITSMAGFSPDAVTAMSVDAEVSRITSMAKVQTSTDALVGTTQQRQVIEQNINQLAMSRVQSETNLVNLKMQEIRADMLRIQAWGTLLGAPARPGTQAQTLEDLLQNVYQTRARQGYGGFVGETSNPI